MKNPELERCPLCASYRVELQVNVVKCLTCGCNTGPKSTGTQAVAAWNNRKKLESD